MSIVLHWWMLPLALLAAGIVTLMFTRIEGSNFPMPSWHLGAGLLLIFAAACTLIGGWLA